ncbi:hypothetical protein [Streptomyces sp. NPDC014746]|uniref:hypothetical protein n=1 Tax=Streptomyces sp. NPDC014746 TaxID=3364904 RepID=UPI003702F9BB
MLDAEVGHGGGHVAVPSVPGRHADGALLVGQGRHGDQVARHQVDVLAEQADEVGQHGQVGDERQEGVVQGDDAAEAILTMDRAVPAVEGGQLLRVGW